jgi:hypothetical protein
MSAPADERSCGREVLLIDEGRNADLIFYSSAFEELATISNLVFTGQRENSKNTLSSPVSFVASCSSA